MGSVSKSKEKTELETKQLPGIFGTAEGRRVGGKLEATALGESIFGQKLLQELQSPTFTPQTEAEKNVLQSALSATQGATAARGLGPATGGALAQTAAPVLQGLRQQRVSGLQEAFAQDLTRQGIDIQALQQLAELVLPQVIAGQKGETEGVGGSFAGGSFF